MAKKVNFEVWALGYESDNSANDDEIFLGRFHDRKSAIEHARRFKDITYLVNDDENFFDDGEYFEIRVETVRRISGIYENTDTVYSTIIY